MKRFISLKLAIITSVIVAISLLFFPFDSYSKRGCCSNHGGVAGCDAKTGFQLCKDGTTSPSCKCEDTGKNVTKATEKVEKTTKTTKKTTKTTSAVTSPEAATTVPASAEVIKTKTVKTTKSKTTGCCSGHGGVAKCNHKTGYQMCKDGTQSTSCKC